MMEYIDQLLVELKRDKKRAIVLAVVAGVGLILVTRLVLTRSSPAPATAAPVEGAEDAPGGAAREETWQLDADISKDDYFAQIDTTITRDIFAPPERFFPSSGTGKKSFEAADGTRSVEKENAWRDAGTMTLASTILSATPKAIIDGQVVQVGDMIRGFRVEEIGSRSVTLERDGVRVSLEMKGE